MKFESNKNALNVILLAWNLVTFPKWPKYTKIKRGVEEVIEDTSAAITATVVNGQFPSLVCNKLSVIKCWIIIAMAKL